MSLLITFSMGSPRDSSVMRDADNHKKTPWALTAKGRRGLPLIL